MLSTAHTSSNVNTAGSYMTVNSAVSSNKSVNETESQKRRSEDRKKSAIEDDPALKIGQSFFKTRQKRLQNKKKLVENLELDFPIAVVGGQGIGKLTLVNTECDTFDTFGEQQGSQSSLSIKIRTKVYEQDNKKAQVSFYVAPGNELYQKQSARYLSGFPVTIYVLDVNDGFSFDILEQWVEDTAPRNSKIGSWSPMQFLIGNKIDTPGTRAILFSEGQEFAQKYEMKYFEMSAHNTEQVNATFKTIMSFVFESSQYSSQPISIAPKNQKRIGSFLNLDGSGIQKPSFDLFSGKKSLFKESERKPSGSTDLGVRLSPFKQSFHDISAAEIKPAMGSLFDLGSRASLNIAAFTGLSKEPAVVEQNYPAILQTGLQLSRRARFLHRKELKQDLPCNAQGTSVLDWM